jgi:SAM-dependent methyltransferase
MDIRNKLNRSIMQIKQLVKPGSFPGSVRYWEERYKKGGTSGSGSYNRLASFKAEILNDFVEHNNITSVIEFGCGDGNQLSLAKYPAYIGLDVAPSAIALCTEKFATDHTKSFFLYHSKAFTDNHAVFKAQLSLSIDVIFHLVEDDIFVQYMHHVFNAAQQYVIIYASNFDKGQLFHEKDRNFTSWVENNKKEWKFSEKIENRYKYDPSDPDNTSKADFYIFKKR